jgi:hypothetical protein
MKRLFLTFLTFIFAIVMLNSEEERKNIWDQEDKVSKLPGELTSNSAVYEDNGSIVDLKNYIIDLGIQTPVNSWVHNGAPAPSIYFRTGLILKENILFSLSGSFYNYLTFSDKNEKTYWSSSSGIVKTEDRDKTYDWTAINNSLSALLAYKVNDKIDLGFLFGGGTSIDRYLTTEDKFSAEYTSSGVIASNYDKIEKATYKEGNGFINAGVGIKLNKILFNLPYVNYVSVYEKFNFLINGNGGLGSIASQNYSETSETEHYSSALNSREYSKTLDYAYTYFGFSNFGGGLIEFNLKNGIGTLNSLNVFNIGLGIGYTLGFRYYNKSYESANIEYKNTSGLFVGGDYDNNMTEYKIKSYLNGGFNIPICLNLQPVSAVEVKISYTPDFYFNYINYEKYSTGDTKQSGSTKSYTDPDVKYKKTDYTFTHNVGVRFRFVFPKVVRLSLGGNLQIIHKWYDLETKRESDTREYSNGTKTTIGSSVYEKENKTGSLTQKLNPFFEMDFEVVKDYAVITLGWSPLVTLNATGSLVGSSVDSTDKISATNILNLACWDLSVIVKFNNPVKK